MGWLRNDVNFLKENKIISIKNFYTVDDNQRFKINFELENNYKKYNGLNCSYNFPIINYSDKFFEHLYARLLETCHKIFGVFSLNDENSKICWCYRSSRNSFYRSWHNHQKTSTINAVYYYQIQDGDSISFLDKNNDEVKYYLTNEEILIFPNYLNHTANPPVISVFDECRYSINIEIKTNETSEELFSRI